MPAIGDQAMPDLEDVLGVQQAWVYLGGGLVAQAHHKDLSGGVS